MNTVLEQALYALELIVNPLPHQLDAIAALKEAITRQGEPVGTVRLVEAADNYSMNSRHRLEVDLDVDLPVGTLLYLSAPTMPSGMVGAEV